MNPTERTPELLELELEPVDEPVLDVLEVDELEVDATPDEVLAALEDAPPVDEVLAALEDAPPAPELDVTEPLELDAPDEPDAEPPEPSATPPSMPRI